MTNSILVPAGTYIVAVSGGVDSVVLLDMLAQEPSLKLIVAHFDHGIRQDSADDAKFVKELADYYALPFEDERAELGIDASEALAREKRYTFLRRIANKYKAQAIITAHHQDDVIETSIINILRGTGRHGLTSLKSNDEIIRPLLQVPKAELLAYAQQHGLSWREDSTNTDTKYLRNKIRHEVVAHMTADQKTQWLGLLNKTHIANEKLDAELQHILRRGLHKNQPVLNRGWFIKLPHDVSKEVVLAILRRAGAKDMDKKTVERLTVQIKTVAHGKTLQAAGVDILLTKRSARFQSRGRQDSIKHV